jgi:phage terminase large subunit GpA-like protein
VDTGKALLFQSLEVEEEGANYCHFPLEREKGYNASYFKGLTAERMVLTYKKGKAQFIWKLKEGHRRNEPLDVRNYARAALEISGITLEKQERPEGTAPPPKRKRRSRSAGIS